ncbi:MFS transporter [Amycolatopsis acidicola]|uniref:MFS transporter n=1 Tax=Amycolatopsis acidicola TaxID=2596893 RepID=A0A5N0VKQ4_9PSEU|nr:MFS transporter [Amycolatopsis acidicola]KAA9166093.1 MFS transporter [Amycolatopsis acidicola]
MTAPGTGPRLLARFGRIPVATRSHLGWAFLLAGVFLFELADLNTFALVAPELRKQWHLSVASVGLVTGLGFVGMFFGSWIGGWLSDRYGRKKPLIWSSVWFSVCSVLSAFTANLALLGVFRVLTGVGLTAMTAVALTYVSEMYPRELRGRYLALIFGMGLAGIPLISWFARAVVPSGTNGWRWVFLIGGLGLVIAVLMVRFLPESVRWQVANGTGDRAEALVARLEGQAVAKLGRDLPEPVVLTEAAPAKGGLRELFSEQYRRRTIVFFIASIFAVVGFYGYNSFVPTLLVERGFDVVQSLTYTSIVQLGALPGAFIAWLFTDRWERKYSLGVCYLLITALALVYGFADQAPVILVSGFLIAMLLQTSTVLAFTYGPEIFPTELRGLGGGLGNGLGRLATFGGSNLLPVIFTSFGYTAVFVYVAAALAISAVAFLGWGERTTRRSLETVSADAGTSPLSETTPQ